ncbi:hypothetical protein GGI20_004901 [Coemansia sp. BCRC 34301]|nr:hypothetical protein GGI20_004901 [Coemansia sp. BCRC 34301]
MASPLSLFSGTWAVTYALGRLLPESWCDSNKNIDTTYRLAFATARLLPPRGPCTALLVVTTNPQDEQRAAEYNVGHARVQLAIALLAATVCPAWPSRTNADADKSSTITKLERAKLVDAGTGTDDADVCDNLPDIALAAVSALSRPTLVDTGVDALLTTTTSTGLDALLIATMSTGFNVPRTANAGTQTCSSQFIASSLMPTSTSAKRRSIDLSRLTLHSALSGASSPVLPLRRRAASADECNPAMRIILVSRLSPANIPVAAAMPAHCPAPSPSSEGEESVVAANVTDPFPEETALEVAGAKASPPVAVDTSTEQRAVAAAVGFVLVETATSGEVALESLEPARPIAQDPLAVESPSVTSSQDTEWRENRKGTAAQSSSNAFSRSMGKFGEPRHRRRTCRRV